MRPAKPFLGYFLLSAIPLLLLAGLNYWNGIRTVNSTISAVVQDDLNSFNARVDQGLREKGDALLRLAISPNIQHAAARKTESDSTRLNVDLNGNFKSLTLFDRDRQPLWCLTETAQWKSWDSTWASNRSANFPKPDPRVWTTHGNVLLDNRGNSPST